eukprot:4207637-Pleurochrysis_carterae.AAC.2
MCVGVTIFSCAHAMCVLFAFLLVRARSWDAGCTSSGPSVRAPERACGLSGRAARTCELVLAHVCMYLCVHAQVCFRTCTCEHERADVCMSIESGNVMAALGIARDDPRMHFCQIQGMADDVTISLG